MIEGPEANVPGRFCVRTTAFIQGRAGAFGRGRGGGGRGGGGLIDAKMRERIAIVCAETHACEYCLSAHVATGKMAGLSESELHRARQMQSEDSKIDIALTFVRNVVLRRAQLPDLDFQEIREAGWTDGEIAEILLLIGLNTFTAYFNLVAQTELDFPKVPLAFPV